MPGGPTSVTSRTSGRSKTLVIAATSAVRPMSGVSGVGRRTCCEAGPVRAAAVAEELAAIPAGWVPTARARRTKSARSAGARCRCSASRWARWREARIRSASSLRIVSVLQPTCSASASWVRSSAWRRCLSQRPKAGASDIAASPQQPLPCPRVSAACPVFLPLILPLVPFCAPARCAAMEPRTDLVSPVHHSFASAPRLVPTAIGARRSSFPGSGRMRRSPAVRRSYAALGSGVARLDPDR